ncbi:hypothetical protein [Streptomyces sp. NPDC048111]|uniref:hypothetical protein n=1 Tax=Streptomyces sp. NPDC048111 TaxID=3365500 RepID=UPI0037114C29
MTALHARPNVAAQEVYDLTVNGLHAFCIRSQRSQTHDILMHNCTNIPADEKPGEEGVGGAHTLRNHVLPDDEAMSAEAISKGIATRWTDEATAAESVNAAVTA